MKLTLTDLIFLMDLIVVMYIVSEKLKSLTKTIFELSFHQDRKEWNRKKILIELSRHNSDNVIDWMIYKKHYALKEKLYVFLGKHDCKNIRRR